MRRDATGRITRPWVVIGLLCLVFIGLRVPVIRAQLPAQDEDYFAVPGWTILQDGIPRIPYTPARNVDSAFYRADEVLFALPPLYFYWQAAFYFVFGATTCVARLASLVAGLGATCLVFLIGRRLLSSQAAALWGAGLYLFSRIVYFPSMTARPDMLCAALGLLCLYSILRYVESLASSRGVAEEHPQTESASSGATRWVVTAGTAGGLGMLTHPFAVLFCLQAGMWLLMSHRTWIARVKSAAIFTVIALVMFALWLPLIAIKPDVFWIQFSNNVLGRSGPGLVERMLVPWDAVRVQCFLFVEHAEWCQAIMLMAALPAMLTVAWWKRRGNVTPLAAHAEVAIKRDHESDAAMDGERHDSQRPVSHRRLVALSVSAIYLHIILQGTHPTKGYWCYTAAYLFLSLGLCVNSVLEAIATRQHPGLKRMAAQAGVCLIVGVLMLKGAGLRTFAAAVTHTGDANYQAPEFTRHLIDRIPAGATVIVDRAFAFDFQRAGRQPLLAGCLPFYFDIRGVPFDYLVAGPGTIRDRVADEIDAVFMTSVGTQDSPFTCYAELYRAPNAVRLPVVGQGVADGVARDTDDSR